ncbi:MAG TPA: substrate-binding domain-containing protein, partial [Bacillota bacterium]|nr:substrate-binding domain-containing protein [Bacillota bacterium]
MQKDLVTRRADGKRVTIGYIARHAYDGLGLEYLKGVYDAALDYDLNLISAIGGSTIVQREINNSEITVGKLLNSQCVDGIITWASSLIYYRDSHNPELFHQRFSGLPLIAIGNPLKNSPSILVDDENASKLLMGHLVEVHHVRRPVYIQGSNHYYAEKRFEGYLKSLQKYEIPFDPNLVVKTSEISASHGVEALRVLLDERKLMPGIDFDAIVTNSDQLSAAIVKELQRRGFRVPKDIPVVGFNNRIESLTCTPPLTTIKTDFRQYGYLAVEFLLKLIAGQHVPQENLMPTELVIRQSCGCFENSVNDVRTHPEMFPHQETPDSLKESITAAVRQFLPQWLEIHKLKSCEYKSYLESVLDSFLGNLFGTVPQNCFLDDMNRLIMFNRNQKITLQALQNFLTRLRCTLLPLFAGHPLMVIAEDLWHQARILIFKALEYSHGWIVTGDNTNSNNLVQIGGIFNTALSIEEFLDLIVKELPRLGIPGCYMALYDDMNHPEATARLILAFNKTGRIDLKNFTHPYPTSHLLPRGMISETERFCFIAQSCFYQDRELGYVIFEMGPLEGAVYEILRNNFNSSLYSALTDKERRRIEKEREMLLSTLELKKAELEEKNHDIKLVNVELQLAIEKVNLANQAKSRFLANMSHEIRTPLNCIVGFAEIMNNTRDDETRTRYTQLIMDESEKLLELINQLLDISKIEAGKLELNNEPFDLLELMNSVDATYRIIAQRKGLTYISNI